MDRAKALERIRKCMALSKSPNEHEAAAALRQAQKLMQMHGVTPDEVDLVEYVSDFVDHDDYEFGNRKPMLIACVCDIMCKAFSVSYTWEASPTLKHRVRYFGKAPNVLLATHSHTVVYRAVNAAWRRHLKERPELTGIRNARASYVLGWCQSVLSKVENLSPDAKEEEMIQKTKMRHYGKELKESKIGSKTIYNSLAQAGHEDGKDFSINRPIDTDRRRLEKL